MIALGSIPVTDFTIANTTRLISTAYIDEPAMSPLVDDDDDLEILEALEGMTSTRRGFIVPMPGGVDPRELLTDADGYGWTYVNAAFCYTRESGNRFNGSKRGAWYAAYGDNATATSQAEVSWHLTRELAAVGVFENITAYRELLASFATRMHDLHGFVDEAFLGSDPCEAYPAGQALARDLVLFGANGVLYPSARLNSGHCLAAFSPRVVQNIRQGRTWQFSWTGGPTPEINELISRGTP